MTTKTTATINFVGDIMVHIAQNGACRTKNGYDYSDILKQVTPFLSSGDYCVANLETPFAGDDTNLSEKLYSFNTPEKFAEAVIISGINLVATANNHCLDREFATTRSITLDNGKSIVVPVYDLINKTKDAKIKEQLISNNRKVVNTFMNKPADTPVVPQEKYFIK